MSDRDGADRLEQARTTHDDAVRAERLARIGAAEDLREQARRRRGGVRLFVVVAVVTALTLCGVSGWALVSRSTAQSSLDDAAAARASAAAAISVMLTADPARADGYVQAVLHTTTGAQRERVESAREQLRDAVAGLGAPSTGRVISAGTQPAAGAAIPVLVVAQASAPELVGGAPGQNRVAVRVMMTESGGRWRVADTERVS